MRLPLVGGIILIVVGAFVLYNGGSITTRRDVVKVGDLKISAEEQHPVAPWVAGAAIIGGLVLLATGASRKS